MNDPSVIVVCVFLGVALGVLIFFALREVVCWYWKVNKMVENQEKQTKLLEEIRNSLVKTPPPGEGS